MAPSDEGGRVTHRTPRPLLALLLSLAVLLVAPVGAAGATPGDGETSDASAETDDESSPGPTSETSPEPTSEPSPEPSTESTSEPSPEPTSEPSPQPSPEPTQDPTAEPSPEPTSEPSAGPTTDPTPTAPEPSRDDGPATGEGDASQSPSAPVPVASPASDDEGSPVPEASPTPSPTATQDARPERRRRSPDRATGPTVVDIDEPYETPPERAPATAPERNDHIDASVLALGSGEAQQSVPATTAAARTGPVQRLPLGGMVAVVGIVLLAVAALAGWRWHETGHRWPGGRP